jgi:hypothetical protein
MASQIHAPTLKASNVVAGRLLTFGERMLRYGVVGLRSLSLTPPYALLLVAVGDKTLRPREVSLCDSPPK